jgi:hypothetical protein
LSVSQNGALDKSLQFQVEQQLRMKNIYQNWFILPPVMAWYYKVSILSIYLCHRSEVIVWEHKRLQWILFIQNQQQNLS